MTKDGRSASECRTTIKRTSECIFFVHCCPTVFCGSDALLLCLVRENRSESDVADALDVGHARVELVAFRLRARFAYTYAYPVYTTALSNISLSNPRQLYHHFA